MLNAAVLMGGGNRLGWGEKGRAESFCPIILTSFYHFDKTHTHSLPKKKLGLAHN